MHSNLYVEKTAKFSIDKYWQLGIVKTLHVLSIELWNGSNLGYSSVTNWCRSEVKLFYSFKASPGF